MTQLAIEIPPPSEVFFAEDFMISSSNACAYERLITPASQSSNMLCLCGPASSGKTHLATLWAHQNHAVIIAPNQLGNAASHELIGNAKSVVVENMHLLAKKENAEKLDALFHLLQHCMTESVALLTTSRIAPMRLNLPLRDAQSRLSLMELLTIEAPDDALLEMVLMKHFSDHQLRVSGDVRSYILKRMDRSFTAARDIVAMLDAQALQAKRDITLPFVKQVWQ